MLALLLQKEAFLFNDYHFTDFIQIAVNSYFGKIHAFSHFSRVPLIMNISLSYIKRMISIF